MRTAVLVGLLGLSACSGTADRIVCPPVVDWPTAFQTQLATELSAHDASEMPAFHQLASLAKRQRDSVKACVK